ncbi:MAG: hypothetical protein OHK0022_00190 [Roseiflexaceae bacterium]
MLGQILPHSDTLLALQRSIGNRAVQRLLDSAPAQTRPMPILLQRSSSSDEMDLEDKQEEEEEEEEQGFDPVQFTVDELVLLMNVFDQAFADLIGEHQMDEIISSLDAIVALSNFVGMHEDEQSPYSSMTGHAFFNLAQNIVGSSEPYGKLQTMVQELRQAGVKDKEMIGLLLTKSYQEFSTSFEKIAARVNLDGLNLTSNQNASSSSQQAVVVEDADEELEQELQEASPTQRAKRTLWMMVQLWNLESARRLSGGVWNTINATLALGSKSPNVTTVFVQENVMSHQGASGKSVNPSPGKFTRYQKSLQILNKLLTTPTENPALAVMKKQIAVFITAITKHSSFANARSAWRDLLPSGKRLPLSMGQSLSDNDDILALLESDEFNHLYATFTAFMQHHYDDEPQPRAIQDQTYGTINDMFVLWLINQAASSGHDQALTMLFENEFHNQPEEDEEDEDDRFDGSYEDRSGGFASIFEDNNAPTEATTWLHVSNLRQAYSDLQDLELLQNIRIHSSRHSQHVDLFFNKYVTSIPQLALILSLFNNRAEGLRSIQYIIQARSQSEFDERMQLITEPLRTYQAYFQTQMQAFAEQATSKRKALQLQILQQSQDLVSKGIIGQTEVLNAGKNTIIKVLAARDPVIATRPPPDVIKQAIKQLKGLWRVYSIIEVARNPGAGGINLLTLHEGTGSKGQPLELEELFVDLNLMSPPGIAQNPGLLEKQIAAAAKRVQFSGPVSSQIRNLLDTINNSTTKENARSQAREDLLALLYDFAFEVLQDDERDDDDNDELPNFASPGWGEGQKRTAAALEGFIIGHADGRGNDCLINTLIQLAARGSTPPQEVLDHQTIRKRLIEIGVTLGGEMLDFYGDDGMLLLDDFTTNYGFRVTVHEVRLDGSVRVHPPRGKTGPMLHILHNYLHFSPMTPKG